MFSRRIIMFILGEKRMVYYKARSAATWQRFVQPEFLLTKRSKNTIPVNGISHQGHLFASIAVLDAILLQENAMENYGASPTGITVK